MTTNSTLLRALGALVGLALLALPLYLAYATALSDSSGGYGYYSRRRGRRSSSSSAWGEGDGGEEEESEKMLRYIFLKKNVCGTFISFSTERSSKISSPPTLLWILIRRIATTLHRNLSSNCKKYARPRALSLQPPIISPITFPDFSSFYLHLLLESFRKFGMDGEGDSDCRMMAACRAGVEREDGYSNVLGNGIVEELFSSKKKKNKQEELGIELFRWVTIVQNQQRNMEIAILFLLKFTYFWPHFSVILLFYKKNHAFDENAPEADPRLLFRYDKNIYFTQDPPLCLHQRWRPRLHVLRPSSAPPDHGRLQERIRRSGVFAVRQGGRLGAKVFFVRKKRRIRLQHILFFGFRHVSQL